MMKEILIFLIFLYILPVTIYGQIYKLALQWPRGVCMNNRCQKTVHYWTVHGFWLNGVPGRCQRPYIPIKNHPNLVEIMERSWPSLLEDDEIFWEKQWNKHGCLTPYSQIGYFNEAISQYNQLDINIRIYQYGFTEGRHFRRYEILSIGRRIAGNRAVEISCTLDSSKQLVLEEMRFCYDQVGGLVNATINCSSRSQSCLDGRGRYTSIYVP